MNIVRFYEGSIVEDPDKEYELFNKVITSDCEQEYYKEVGKKKTLIEIQGDKIKESKSLLETYLNEHPLLSSVKNNVEKYYTCTKDKQNQLVQTLSLYNLSVQSNTKYKCMWNSMGQPCEEWTIDELTILSFQMQSYVYPFIRYQQDIEVKIMECKNKEEVEMIEIDYAKVGVSNDEENYDE